MSTEVLNCTFRKRGTCGRHGTEAKPDHSKGYHIEDCILVDFDNVDPLIQKKGCISVASPEVNAHRYAVPEIPCLVWTSALSSTSGHSLTANHRAQDGIQDMVETLADILG